MNENKTSKTIAEIFSRMTELRKMIRNVGPNDEARGEKPRIEDIKKQEV